MPLLIRSAFIRFNRNPNSSSKNKSLINLSIRLVSSIFPSSLQPLSLLPPFLSMFGVSQHLPPSSQMFSGWVAMDLKKSSSPCKLLAC